MHRYVRHSLFAFFVALFLVSAPIVVLYTAGYRYNPKNGHVVRAGVLSVTSSPRGADILLSGAETEQQTPYIFNRVMPGTYTVTIAKEGYHAYEETVTVESGKTTYVADVLLFPIATPTLREAETATLAVASFDGTQVALLRRATSSAELWRYSVRSGAFALLANIPLATDDACALSLHGDGDSVVLENRTQGTRARYAFDTNANLSTVDTRGETAGLVRLVKNDTGVEVHSAVDTEDTLRARLPLDTYTIAETDGAYAVLTSTNGRIVLLAMDRAQPILLMADGTVFDWNGDLERLAWSDGIETNIFNVASGTSAFVTRQSDPVRSLALHGSGTALFVATATQVQALLLDRVGSHATTLMTADTIDLFFADSGDRALYFLGTSNGARGLYEVEMR